MAFIEDESRARTLARAIASDLSMYHEEKVVQGIREDNLFEVMAELIKEHQELFESRISRELVKLNLFNRALVDVLVRSKGHIESPMW